MSRFNWSRQKGLIALALAQGETQKEVAEAQNVTDRTIRRWLADTEFSAEVNRLSLMLGVANRAERLRIANRIVRQRTKGDIIESARDLLDWLKFAQTETDGLNLGLTETVIRVSYDSPSQLDSLTDIQLERIAAGEDPEEVLAKR